MKTAVARGTARALRWRLAAPVVAATLFGVGVAIAATTPAADLMINGGAGDGIGTAVVTGDFNGDGRPDLAVGAPGAASAGQVYIFVSPPTAAEVAGGSARAVYGGEASGDNFGGSLAAGDVNGDGVDDLVVGAARADAGPGMNDIGRAYVFITAPGGPANASAIAVPQFTGEAQGDRFGDSVAAGDVNGDGRADLIAGAERNDAAGSDAGRAYVFLTPPTGPASTPAAAATATFTGQAANDRFGKRVLAASLNRDAFADIVVSATKDSGRVYIFPTPPGGPVALAAASAPAVLTGETSGDDFGGALASADVNRDGLGDLIVGAATNDAAGVDAGKAYVFTTPAAGPLNAPAATAGAVFAGEAGGDRFGTDVGSVDVNADGVQDLIVGAARNDATGNDAGRTYVFRSGGGGPVSSAAAGARPIYAGETGGDRFGATTTGADLNDDGVGDPIVAASDSAVGGGGAGRVYAFYDTDGDGQTNIVDADDDNDGRPDAGDRCPTSKPPLRDRRPRDGCNDPRGEITAPARDGGRVKGKTIVLKGTAYADAIGVAKVDVALQKKVGRLCRNWTGRKLTRPARCGKRRFLRAKGTRTWSLTARRLPKGRWTAFARATDRKRHVERRFGKNNRRKFSKR